MKAIVRSIISASCLAGLLFLVFAVSSDSLFLPIAQAQELERSTRCSERLVEGRYAFALQGNVARVGPIAASGTTTFDGNRFANLTGFINTTSGTPAIETSMDGTYTVNPDCTASATFNIPAPGLFGVFTELRFEAVIVNRGDEIRYLITTPGVVFAGSSVRLFPRHRHP